MLKAVGKNGGKVVYIEEIKTAGPPAALRLKINSDSLIANSQDVAHIEVQIVDSDGNVVPTADNLVIFSIEGEGKIIGVDNGNPQDHQSYKINQRNVFNGLCLAIVQSINKSGKIKLTVKSDGLKGETVEIISIERNMLNVLN